MVAFSAGKHTVGQLLVQHCLCLLVAVMAMAGRMGYAQSAVEASAFHTVLASSKLMVATRVVVPNEAGGGGRYVLVETRLGEPMLEGLHLTSELLAVVDCNDAQRRFAVLRQLRNNQPVGVAAQWAAVAGSQVVPAPPEWGNLPFVQVVAPQKSEQRLQLPGVWQVVSHYACALADRGSRGLVVTPSVDGMQLRWSTVLAQGAAALAKQVNLTGGLADVLTWRCPLADRVGYRAGEMEVAFSPSVGAVRVNDTWVGDGPIDDRYFGFELNGLTFRFMRDTGVMRIVRRDEMQLVASALCVPVLPDTKVKSGW